MPLSQDNKRELLALIWSLKPSDFSILHVCLHQLPTDRDVQIATVRGSGNSIFYSQLETWGLAKEIPSQEVDMSFSLTPEGKEILPQAIKFALNNGWPPKNSIIPSETIAILKKYVEQDNHDSQNKLGLLYLKGWGVEENHTEALKLFLMAAEKENTTAYNNIGFMHFVGIGTPKNIDEAIIWFRKAADLGDATSMDNIGEIYLTGNGVTQNHLEAFKWFHMAADLGYGLSQYKVGCFYGTGLGVPQDNEKAYMWLRLAMKAGTDTKKLLEEVASKMTNDEIQAANVLVNEWSPKKFG